MFPLNLEQVVSNRKVVADCHRRVAILWKQALTERFTSMLIAKQCLFVESIHYLIDKIRGGFRDESYGRKAVEKYQKGVVWGEFCIATPFHS